MSAEFNAADWALQTGGPSALMAYFLYQISSQLGELKGMMGKYVARAFNQRRD